MFGYVRAYRPEMKFREYDMYRGAYCGVCLSMKRETGTLSRLTLSYDFAFLALCRAVLSGEKPVFAMRRCVLHPLRPHPVWESTDGTGEVLGYCARASGLLTYYKALDERRDGGFLKRLLVGAVFPFFKDLRKHSDLPGLDAVVSEKLDVLSLFEKTPTPSVDKGASLFGELLGEVFRFGFDGGTARVAYTLGYHTGRFIYIADAAEDLDSDRKSGNYNPFLSVYGDNFGEKERRDVLTALGCETAELERALDLMDFSDCPDIQAILYNTVRFGMPAVMERALGLYHGKNEKCPFAAK